MNLQKAINEAETIEFKIESRYGIDYKIQLVKATMQGNHLILTFKEPTIA